MASFVRHTLDGQVYRARDDLLLEILKGDEWTRIVPSEQDRDLRYISDEEAARRLDVPLEKLREAGEPV
jgi:hypothetical protein